MYNLKIVWMLIGLLFIHVKAQTQDPTPKRLPNIILVMVDDMGTEALGSYGGTSYKTPVLDKLAEEGVRFNQAYAYPLCTPTRVSLMTGKYNFRNWKYFGILDPEETTFGHLMQDQGYKTCMVGKWQLQSYDPPNYPGSELRRNTGMKVEHAGFDEYCMWHTGHTEDKGSRFADPLIYQNGAFLQNTNNKYGPDIFTDYLLDFIDRNREAPFFAYYPMALTHGPFVPTPDSKPWEDPTLRHKQDNKYFKDMVEYTDKLMGRILDKLDQLKLREQTLFIFYSDNGTHLKLSSMKGKEKVQGGKGRNTDAGTRVPLIVSWPEYMQGGRVSEAMIASPDFIPTLFEAMERPLPMDFHTDGQSFLSALKEEPVSRRSWVFIDHDPRPGWDKKQFRPRRFVRGPQYKLYADGRFFEVEKDSKEEHPLAAAENKKIYDQYRHILDSLRKYPVIGGLEKLDLRFDELVPPETEVEVIAEGFTWSEGPLWVPEMDALLFSDVPRNRIYKWTEAHGIEVFLHKSGYTGEKARSGGKGSNGLALDENGNLILCRHGDREIARLVAGLNNPHPVFASLATQYQGKRFNSPNDLTLDKEGNIYFTDPPYGMDRSTLPASKELDFQGVFRLSKSGEVSLLTSTLERPNGIGLSPESKTVYVANSDPPYIMAYDLDEEGKVKQERMFFDAKELVEKSVSKQSTDGMAIDDKGNLFVAGPDGILVFLPDGTHVGSIKTYKRTSNCAFNEDFTVLYATTHDYIVRIVLGYKLGASRQ